jgi:hypothetical protein
MRLLGTSWTDNDANLHSHAQQIRVSGIGLKDANSARRAIRNNRAQIGGLLQSQRVFSGPDSGQDVLKLQLSL